MIVACEANLVEQVETEKLSSTSFTDVINTVIYQPRNAEQNYTYKLYQDDTTGEFVFGRIIVSRDYSTETVNKKFVTLQLPPDINEHFDELKNIIMLFIHQKRNHMRELRNHYYYFR
ncbi:MAG: hypothetical protein UMR38_02920 [Candidatus Izemoplasma sp.]|nr:hypothetical protein [Candidatus Izemoplasma sp.]